MASFVNHDAETELLVLKQWWSRNSKPFTDWYLKLSNDERAQLLRKACPDLPKVSPASRAKAGEKLNATDLILPEISEDALLAANGRICTLFIDTQLSGAVDTFKSDIKLLDNLYKNGRLPAFGNQKKLEELDTPFIDPNDPDENVCVATTDEQRRRVLQVFENYSLVRCQIWIALKIRRSALAAFHKNLFEDFEDRADEIWRPKPLFWQLLKGEMEQQKAFKSTPGKAAANNSEPGTPGSVASVASVTSDHFISSTGLDELS